MSKYANHITSLNPVHYWRFNDVNATVEPDLIGNVDWTVDYGSIDREQPAMTVNDPSAKSTYFNADRMITGTPTDLGTTWSMEMWLALENTATLWKSVAIVDGSTHYGLWIKNAKLDFYIGTDQLSTIDLVQNQAYHIVLTCDNTDGKFYIDGVESGTFTAVTPFHVKYLHADNNNNYSVHGKFQEFALYNKVLTQDEITINHLVGLDNLYGIEGTTAVNGTPTQCTVRAYNRNDGSLHVDTQSDVNGDYLIYTPNDTTEYDLLCFAGTGICPQASGPITGVQI